MDDEIPRIRTHLKGFDEVLKGGVPAGYLCLLQGAPGTLKSSIGYNILYNNAKLDGKNGLFITLEQSKKTLLQHCRSIGMPHADVRDGVNVIDIAYLRKTIGHSASKDKWFDVIQKQIQFFKENVGYEILVIDSLSALEIVSGFRERREDLFEFFEWVRDLEVTTFLISELSLNGAHDDEVFLADGVIRLLKERQGRSSERLITVEKMRATAHNTDYWTILLNKTKGFEVTQAISGGF